VTGEDAHRAMLEYMKVAGIGPNSDVEAGRPFWEVALWRSKTERRIRVLRALWAGLREEERPEALRFAIRHVDFTQRELCWLHLALAQMRQRKTLLFDSDKARAAFDELPHAFTVYRGTDQSEQQPRYGRSWTTDRVVAQKFAMISGKHRDLSRPPVILSAQICKDDVSGFLMNDHERGEKEVIVAPDVWQGPHRVVTTTIVTDAEIAAWESKFGRPLSSTD
jgi:hypothetical protein